MVYRVGRAVMALGSIVVTMCTLIGQAPQLPAIFTHEELVQRRAQGKGPFDTKWIVREDGALTQSPNPATGGMTDKGIPFVLSSPPTKDGSGPLVEYLSHQIRSWRGTASWLAPLLRHPGDLLGSTNAEYHFAKLGRRSGTVDLRLFLMQPSEATGPILRRDLLDRELAVRLLTQRGAGSSRGELQAIVTRTKDVFLRHAAQQALASVGVGAEPAVVKLADMPIAVLAKADLWIWIDTTVLRPREDVAQSVRLASRNRMWRRLLDIPRDIKESILAGAQFLIDRPEELPFEAARTWGRARIDQCLLAVSSSEEGVTLAWAAASGCFETSVLDSYLTACDIAHTTKDGVVHSDTWWPGYRVEVAPDHIVVCHQASVGAATGEWPAVVAAAKAAKAGLAFEVPPGSRHEAMAWLPVMESSVATVGVSPFSMSITTRSDRATARSAYRRYAAWIDEHASQSLPPELAGRWSQAFRDARIARSTADGERADVVQIQVSTPDLDLWRLWPLLHK